MEAFAYVSEAAREVRARVDEGSGALDVDTLDAWIRDVRVALDHLERARDRLRADDNATRRAA